MTVYVISDLHLGHKAIINFKEGGHPLRPFETLGEMHKVIVDRWNSVIKGNDKVYVLGDVAMNKSVQKLLAALPGNKRLVRGNHDQFSDQWYHDAGFQRIYGVRQINGIWLTHVPMHPCTLAGRALGNIHGHMHSGLVMCDGPTPHEQVPDMRYFNACVEQIEYTPVSIEQVIIEQGWGPTI